MIRDIEGRHNHSVKLARKLQKKKHRRERGLLVCEGLDLLRLAFEAQAEIGDVLVRRDILPELPAELLRRAEAGGVDIGVCSEETLADASSLGGSADVVFVCRQPQWSLADLDLARGTSIYLEEVGDPGNVGTLVRGCAGFGATGLIVSPRTADPYGPKAMRAGMGAQFIVPVVLEVSPEDLLAHLGSLLPKASLAAEQSAPSGAGAGQHSRPQVVVADPYQGDHARALADGDRGQGVVVVLGSERQGPSDNWDHARRVTIPQARFDSLNVAMAGTILLYELSRRPGGPGDTRVASAGGCAHP